MATLPSFYGPRAGSPLMEVETSPELVESWSSLELMSSDFRTSMPLNIVGADRSLVVGDWMLPRDLDGLNGYLEGLSARDILAWARDAFGSGVVASSSFQTQSMPLLHMISDVMPDVEVFFLDTGYHFPETLAYRKRVTGNLGLNIRVLRADGSGQGSGGHGELYHSDPDLCCYVNKVEPLNLALADKTAWITGIRRDQTASRSQARIIDVRPDGVYKLAPLLSWTESDIAAYIREHDLPEHPLTGMGYASIGCAPCTRPVGADGDARSGRWTDLDKTECGLHSDTEPTEEGA